MENQKSIYKEIITAKNGTPIPVLVNNKTIESRYNPEAGCLRIIDSIKPATGFLLVLGYSSGILISELLKKIPKMEILVLEVSSSDWEFLKQNQLLKNQKINITYCTLKNLKNTFLKKYIPAIYGDFQIIEQHPWLEINKDYIEKIKNEIENTISEIQQDYSTQAFFGKTWTSNILNNIKIYKKINNHPLKIESNKKAVIIAAGPSLDNTIKLLKENRNQYIIFSTDTAFSTLLKHKIKPDFVISIDGQFISYNHFFNRLNGINFFFDLCANSSCSNSLINTGNNIYFFTSGHPLAEKINSLNNNNFIKLYNGAGTVTIAAVDLAIKCGFTEIEVLGADFSYKNGKSYVKGTYLDKLYLVNANKIKTSELKFDSLLFRTKLYKNPQNNLTTSLLDSYRISFENYLLSTGCKFYKENDIYKITCFENHNFFNISEAKIDYEKLSNLLENIHSEENLPCLLPLIAYLRKKDNNTKTFDQYVKLAHSIIISYN